MKSLIKLDNAKTQTNIEKIDFPKDWSIDSVTDFFSTCLKATRELPIYAVTTKSSNGNLKEVEDLYIRLLDIYDQLPSDNESFISGLINSFINQFSKMTNNLACSGIRFKDGVIPNKLVIEPNQKKVEKQYIFIPFKKIPEQLDNDKWKIIYSTSRSQINNRKTFEQQKIYKGLTYVSQTNLKNTQKHIDNVNQELEKREMELRKRLENQRKIDDQKNLNQLKTNINKDEDNSKKQNKENKKPIEMTSLKIVIKKRNRSENPDNNNEGNKKDNPGGGANPSGQNELTVNTDIEEKKNVQIKLDLTNFTFDEEIILNLVINRMKSIEEQVQKGGEPPSLGAKKDLDGLGDKSNEKTIETDLSVIQLYDRGVFLANKIVKEISEKKVPFSLISVRY